MFHPTKQFTEGTAAEAAAASSSSAAAAAGAGAPKTASWSPYSMNGGTVLGISGRDYAVAVGDTRHSTGYSINSRSVSKLVRLTEKCVLATAGMHADAMTLHKMLKWRLAEYEHNTGKQMSTPAIAQLLSVTLYYKRFFPYYTFNVLCGVDEEGVGAVYSYDAIGSYERTPYSAAGSGSTLIQPLLDAEVGQKHKPTKTELDVDAAVALVKDAITGAAERDIYTGDSAEILVITPNGIRSEVLPLRAD